jgi:hypothetical protein
MDAATRRSPNEAVTADVVVYGGTPGGIAAAIQIARMGPTAVLVAAEDHVGGMTANGLSATDFGRRAAIGGIARQFHRRLGRRYGREEEAWTFEPRVAESVLTQMLVEAGVPCHLGRGLCGVIKEGARIRALEVDGGRCFEASVFVDATYEGDLMAAAGVSYVVGREASTVYGEWLAGVHRGDPNHKFRVPVDPFRIPGRPRSGLLPGVGPHRLAPDGAGDHRVQAYCFRAVLTRDPANRRPIPKPYGYDADRHLLLLRYIEAGVWDALDLMVALPGGKVDVNNWGAVSLDHVGQSHGWPDADRIARARIFREHVDYQQGMMWFLANDPRVPRAIREEAGAWGLPRDEFERTGGWPRQLYVREARRMIGAVVMTEHHARGRVEVFDPVGLAAYLIDSHNCQRVVEDGRAVNEGNLEVATPAPFPIAYGALLPRRQEAGNLLVPVALSASHVAFSAIRIEPTFMILGQAAGTAAATSLLEKTALHDVPYAALRDRLVADGQILQWDPRWPEEARSNPQPLKPIAALPYDVS